MENKLDKLFRDKLEHHSMQPSANAWEKVAAGFPKKNNTIVWAWRIAAALALVGMVSLLVISSRTGNETSTLADQTVKKKSEQVIPAETKKAEVIEGKPESSQQKVVKQRKSVTPKVFNRPVEQGMVENGQVVTETPDETIAATETQMQTIELPAITETKSTTQEKTLVIVYTLAPVESKPAEEPVKTKTLQRVLTFAKDVKGGETTTMASVRDWKDNFFGNVETTRTEKQNSNN